MARRPPEDAIGVEIDCVQAEIDFFQWGDRLTWFLCGWSKLTWFLCAGRKSLGFRVNVEVELVFVCVVVIDLISELGSDLTLSLIHI